jgi:hypothetical protein
VSREIVLGKLIDKALVLALEHGGAERGLFILSRDGVQRVAGEATVVRGTATVRFHDDVVTPVDVPDAVLDAVARTRERVLLHDVAAGELASDRALRERQARSLVCLPLITDGEPLGALYLEAPTPHAFTPGRIEILELLAAQAAISLRLCPLGRGAPAGGTRGSATRRGARAHHRRHPGADLEGAARRLDRFHQPAMARVPRRREQHSGGLRSDKLRLDAYDSPDDIGHVLAHWSTHLSSEEPYEDLSRVRRCDGQYRWLLARGLPHRDDTGVVRWYGIAFDVQDPHKHRS